MGFSAHRVFALALALSLAALCGAVGGTPATYPWEDRLRGDAIVLLGELHDNPVQHRLRLEVLQRAFAAGWRPAIAMEQFDREHQADIERARSERPLDAGYLIEQAAPRNGKPGSGWNWEYYRPYVALALQYRVPLLAANLSRSDAEKIVVHGYSGVFETAAVQSLGLDHERPQLLAAQEKEIDIGHCHAMPKEQLPSMARAQIARDAVMATILREHDAQGVVLLAGDGHVRRDIGVPTSLDPTVLTRVFAVGFLERGEPRPPDSAFDAVVNTDPAPRPDPCASLRRGPAARKPVMIK
jgi:uncharacterized iron-regulated protein